MFEEQLSSPKLDRIKICTAYKYKDKAIEDFPFQVDSLRECEPIYEEMSVHYCREITDQLLRLSPKIPSIVESAREITGNSKLGFGDLLNDDGFNRILQSKDYNLDCIPFQILGMKTGYRIFLSKMDKVFKVRQISATELDNKSNTELVNGKFWKIVVKITWKASKRDPEKQTQTVIIVGDNL